MPETPLQPVKKSAEPVTVTYLPSKQAWRQRFAGTFRSWARNTFSRESYVSSIKSLLWVVPLTVLIWIYAEREQEETQSVVIHVQPPAGENDRVVRLVPANSLILIDAKIKARQADIDQVRQWIENTPIALEVDHSLAAGEHQIEIASQLNKLAKVKESGATVFSCVPAEETISVDPMTEKDVDVVAARTQETISLQQPPVFTPAKVKIRGPASEIDRAAKSGQLLAYANFTQFAPELAQPGNHEIPGVPLSPPPGLNATIIRFSQPTVNATVEVPKTVQKIGHIRLVTVFAGYPKVDKADQWRAQYTNTINQLEVTGPENLVTALEKSDQPVVAYFQVNPDNPDGNPRPAKLTFDLPAGVRVTDQNEQKTSVMYTLEKRNP